MNEWGCLSLPSHHHPNRRGPLAGHSHQEAPLGVLPHWSGTPVLHLIHHLALPMVFQAAPVAGEGALHHRASGQLQDISGRIDHSLLGKSESGT